MIAIELWCRWYGEWKSRVVKGLPPSRRREPPDFLRLLFGRESKEIKKGELAESITLSDRTDDVERKLNLHRS